jgi:hypothetical protein
MHLSATSDAISSYVQKKKPKYTQWFCKKRPNNLYYNWLADINLFQLEMKSSLSFIGSNYNKQPRYNLEITKNISRLKQKLKT